MEILASNLTKLWSSMEILATNLDNYCRATRRLASNLANEYGTLLRLYQSIWLTVVEPYEESSKQAI